MDGIYASGQYSTACWSFDRNALSWDYHGQGLTTLGGNYSGEGGCAAYDRINNRVWSAVGAGANSLGQSIYSLDAATGAITQHSIAMQVGRPRWTAIAHDLGIWILGCPIEQTIEIVDLTDPEAGTRVIRTSGSPNGFQDGVGAVYHAPSRAVLCWHGYGASIRKLSIPSDPLSGDYIWSQVPPAGSNGVIPSSPPTTGTYSRFNIIENMGNGQSALCVVNGTTEPVFVYKLPASEV